MSDDEADQDLLELLRQHLGMGPKDANAPPETGVLSDAQYVCDNSLDVALDFSGTRAAAEHIYQQMTARKYSTKTWSEHQLHPKLDESNAEDTLNFIFTVDLLNFSFWCENDDHEDGRFAVEYAEKTWTGYWALVACLQRALDESVPITSPSFWHDPEECTDEVLEQVFRSSTSTSIPMMIERISMLREASEILCKNFDLSIAQLVSEADHSAARLVNLLAEYFPGFRDEVRFEGRKVRFLKRAQIFVADLWACFSGAEYGDFSDISTITMFADYRVPQMLHTLGCLVYSPLLERRIRRKEIIEAGNTWEIELRGCSIWCVEKIRREIIKSHPDAEVHAVLIDFFLYDAMKEMEKDLDTDLASKGEQLDIIPHHRTRSIWY